MHRAAIAVCLSLSIIAVSLAVVSFLGSRSALPSTDPDGGAGRDRLTEVVAALRRDVAELTAKYEELTRPRVSESPTEKQKRSSIDPEAATRADALEKTVAALQDRLNTLESAERIHILAQSGRKQIVRRKLMTALHQLDSDEASPEERIDAMVTLRGMHKQNQLEVATAMKESDVGEADLAWPMIEIARDTDVAPDVRGEALRSLTGMKTPEIRQPLMEIFASNDAVEVRVGAFEALAWHMSDPTVRQALRDGASESQPAEIRSRVMRLAPKLDYFDRQQAERAAAGETGAEPSGGK